MNCSEGEFNKTKISKAITTETSNAYYLQFNIFKENGFQFLVLMVHLTSHINTLFSAKLLNHESCLLYRLYRHLFNIFQHENH